MQKGEAGRPEPLRPPRNRREPQEALGPLTVHPLGASRAGGQKTIRIYDEYPMRPGRSGDLGSGMLEGAGYGESDPRGREGSLARLATESAYTNVVYEAREAVREALYADGRLFMLAPEYSGPSGASGASGTPGRRPRANSEANTAKAAGDLGSPPRWESRRGQGLGGDLASSALDEGATAPAASAVSAASASSLPRAPAPAARIEARDLVGTTQATLSQRLSARMQEQLAAQQAQFWRLRLSSPLGQRVQSPDLGRNLAEQAHALLGDFSAHVESMCEVAGENLAAVTQEYDMRVEMLGTAAEADYNRLRALLLDLEAQYAAQKEAEGRTESDANDELTAFILRRANNPNSDLETNQRMVDIARAVQRRGAALQAKLRESIGAAREALAAARAALERYLDLRCPLCDARFDAAGRLPIVCAPCGHTLCAACVQAQTGMSYSGECLSLQYQLVSCQQCGRELTEATLDRVLAARVATPQLDHGRALSLAEGRLAAAEEVASSARFTEGRAGRPEGP